MVSFFLFRFLQSLNHFLSPGEILNDKFSDIGEASKKLNSETVVTIDADPLLLSSRKVINFEHESSEQANDPDWRNDHGAPTKDERHR